MLQLSVCVFKSVLIPDINAELHDVGMVLFIRGHFTLSQDMSLLWLEINTLSVSINQKRVLMTTDHSEARKKAESFPTSGSVELVTVLW